jgi:hypothetical protein
VLDVEPIKGKRNMRRLLAFAAAMALSVSLAEACVSLKSVETDDGTTVASIARPGQAGTVTRPLVTRPVVTDAQPGSAFGTANNEPE